MKKLLFIPLIVTLISCNFGPSEIAYGEQSCHFCQMTIVDKQHAAQLVTDKGKVFNFDAAECMINYIPDVEEDSIGMLLVSDYNNPESLIDAETATFIISENIPSPMGAYLSAVQNNTEAEKFINKNTGERYSWETIKEFINKKP